MDNTPNINLKKPKPEDYYNIKDHNDNSDILDTKIKELDAGKIGKDMIGQNNGVAGVSARENYSHAKRCRYRGCTYFQNH